MNIKITGRNLLTHVFFFFFFLALPALVFERLPGESLFTITRVIVQDTIANFILLCFFYLNYYVLIPDFYFKKRYLLYVSLVTLFLFITLPLPHLIGNFLNDDPSGFPPPLPGQNGPPDIRIPGSLPHRVALFSFSIDEFKRHLYLFFTAVFFSFLLRTRRHMSQLKEDKLNAELTTLKAQINPHFLFNTLNSIYALSVKKDDKTSDAILQLAGLMRYATKDANDYVIPLQKEIDYITNFIELQRARLNDTVNIVFECTGSPVGKKIAPLILITYIENAFKYGVNPDADDCFVNIYLHATATGIVLKTLNKKVLISSAFESTGIGMKNTKERLNHLYAGKYTLEIDESEETYSLQLTLNLS